MRKSPLSLAQRLRRFLWVLTAGLALAACLYTGLEGLRLQRLFAPGERFPAAVTRVSDGDTIAARLKDDATVTIRLIGIDTPEIAHKKGETSDPYGDEAAAYAREALAGREVLLEYDAERLDRYGRTLAYVWLDEEALFNEELVRLGYARVYPYPPNTKYADRFARAEAAAQRDRLGLWH